ncbi:PAS domain-containing sensor histidine kinase, partial [Romboutsia sp.]|uniref:PAS domain-containing sensor histidine kinase n=1 Tax=Romboutsia sp. TaxID=1965302 RepID=UPI002D7FEA0F
MKFYSIIINLSRVTLLWILLYELSYNTKLKNNKFSKLMVISSITFIVIASLTLIQKGNIKFQTFLLTITIINLFNVLYFKYGCQNKNLIRDTIILCMIMILVGYILYKIKTDIVKTYIIIIGNLTISCYNSFFYKNKNFEYYKIIKTLSDITFIMNITLLLTVIYKDIINIDLQESILLLLLFSHTYVGYEHTIKNIIHNPYFELKSRNEKLNFNSKQLNTINNIISKEIIIQYKIKKYIIQRKELLKQSLNIMPCILMITDCNFKITYKNNKFIEVLGDDICTFLEIAELINIKGILENLEELKYKKDIVDKLVFLNKIPYILNINYNDTDNSYLIILNDIKNEFKMEKELENKKEEYESIVKNIPAPIMMRDVEENIDDIKIISINKEFEKLFGYSANEIEGMSLIDYYNKFSLDFFDNKRYKKIEMTTEDKINDVQRVIGTNYIINCTMIDKYKKEHNLELSIKDYIQDSKNLKLLSYRDKTKEISIYQKINNQYQLYKKMLDSMPEGIIVESISSKKIIYTNKKFKEIFGIREKNIGIWTRKYRDRLETKYLHNLNSGNANKTIHIVNEDKKIKEVKIYCKTWMLDNLKCRVKIIHDLGEQREAEKIKEMLTKQREYDKIKMEFYANISHELKTPLNNIYSSTQLVETLNTCEKIKDNNGEISYHVKIIKQNMFRLMRLIDNIINISQVKSEIYKLKAINFDIVYLVEEIVMSINSYAKSRDLRLVFDTNEEYLLVGLDPESIERIVLNLISNAIKFTPRKGEILIAVYKVGNKVQIKVKDSGIGIDEEKLMEIFDRFKQIENGKMDNEFGSGIGLYLSKSLIEIQDGRID